MHPLEIIKKEIGHSTLGPDEQEKFLWFLSRMPERYLIDIHQMSLEDPHFLEFLWSNYSRKEKAFSTNDKVLLEDILKEEKSVLDQMNHE